MNPGTAELTWSLTTTGSPELVVQRVSPLVTWVLLDIASARNYSLELKQCARTSPLHTLLGRTRTVSPRRAPFTLEAIGGVAHLQGRIFRLSQAGSA